jgi:predicted dehydrogenase
LTAAYAGRKFGIPHATSDLEAVLADTSIRTIVVATRHDSHSHYVCRALEAGKNVFVEKPLALNAAELARVVATYRSVASERTGRAPILAVGFNRRFAPQIKRMKSLLDELHEPKSFIITVNAGAIPKDHWVHDPVSGGGRIVGEGCHFIDLMRFLCGCPIASVQATMMGGDSSTQTRNDKMSITLSFADGSFGTVHYLANGHRTISKERIEVFCAGRVIQLDNFRRMNAVGWKTFRRLNLWQQDKGHIDEVRTFLKAVESGGPPPISIEELAEVTQASFDAVRAAECRQVISISPPSWPSVADYNGPVTRTA